MKKLDIFTLLLIASLSLVGCESDSEFGAVAGGGDSSEGSGDGEGDGETNTPDGDESEDDSVATTPDVRMGYLLNGTQFTESGIETGLAAGATLSAGQSTSLEVVLYDVANDALHIEPANVTFSSGCTGSGDASIVSTITQAQPVATDDGRARATYTAEGCDGDDVIRATATVSGSPLVATVTITVAGSNTNSIQFESAVPNVLGLAGTGVTSTSKVSFKVSNDVNGPVKNQDVSFELVNAPTGVTLTPATAQTDSNGVVSVVVSSGTVPGPVFVKASTQREDGVTVEAQSRELAVSSAVPTSRGVSLSFSKHNPEGWNRDNVEVEVTASLTDYFGSNPPENTPITFFASAGAIEPSCRTLASGSCSVIWRSRNPRPTEGARPGIFAVIAVTGGEEYFVDTNSNGVLDTAGEFASLRDAPEPFLDADGDEAYTSGEFFIDENQDEMWTDAASDGTQRYNGPRCDSTTNGDAYCDRTNESARVFDQAYLSMSSAPTSFQFLVNGVAVNSMDITGGCGGGACSVSIVIADVNGNSVPGDSTIAISGTDIEVIGADACPNIPTNTIFPTACGVSVKTDDEPGTGELRITVTTPSGLSVTSAIPVTD